MCLKTVGGHERVKPLTPTKGNAGSHKATCQIKQSRPHIREVVVVGGGACWQEHDSPPYLTLGGAADPVTFDWEEVKAAAATAATTKGRGGVCEMPLNGGNALMLGPRATKAKRLVSAICFRTFSVPVGAV